jgi:lipid-A-disaccharide synthase
MTDMSQSGSATRQVESTENGGHATNASTARRHVMMLAGEYSGSLYGAVLARRLIELSPQVRLTGIGGHHMADAGVDLFFDSSDWGGIGLIEALKRVPVLAWVYMHLKRRLREDRPDLIILIDYPGFNMRVARLAKSLGIPTLYYFPPGKYRSAPESVQDAARTITRVAAPLYLAFEKYTALNAAVDFVGHPLLDVLSDGEDQAHIRQELGLGPNEQAVGLLPGSRLAELEFHTPAMCQAAKELVRTNPQLRFFIPVVNYRQPGLSERFVQIIRREIEASGAPIKIISSEQAYKVMAIARLLVVSSGTATLEAAFFGTPMVIIYRVSKLTEFFAPLFHQMPFKFVGLPNILADRKIVPELVQDDFTTANVVREARAILDDETNTRRIHEELKGLVPLMGSKGATDRVARIALEMIHS